MDDRPEILLSEFTDNELESERLSALQDACNAAKYLYEQRPGTTEHGLADRELHDIDRWLCAIEDEMAERELLFVVDEDKWQEI
jgi:hypothetical protein